jgi:hypothetical protein
MTEGCSSDDIDVFVLFLKKSDTLLKVRNSCDDNDKQEVTAQLRAAYTRA